MLAVADVYAGEQCCRQGGNLVIETIMARRSVRMYKDMPVERCKLQKIVECGINAPSGMNKQPWQVRVVDSREYIDGITGVFRKANPRMADDASFKNMFRNAPAVIFIASPADGSGQLDCGLLGENMILAAQSMGLGTCCLGGPVAFMNAMPMRSRMSSGLISRKDTRCSMQLLWGIPTRNLRQSRAMRRKCNL